MTPQNYYARRGVRCRQAVDLGLALALVQAEREQQPRLGVRKLYHLIGPELKAAEGVKLGQGPAVSGVGQSGVAGGAQALGMAQNHAGGPESAGIQEPDQAAPLEGSQPGVGGGHHLHPDPGGFYVSGPDHRPLVAARDRGLPFETLETEQVLKALAMAVKGAQRVAAANPSFGSGDASMPPTPTCAPCGGPVLTMRA